MSQFEVIAFETADGKSPFQDWYDGIKDNKARVDGKLVLLLAGSTKHDQDRAIAKAQEYLEEANRRLKS